jgi:hypothetical protein
LARRRRPWARPHAGIRPRPTSARRPVGCDRASPVAAARAQGCERSWARRAQIRATPDAGLKVPTSTPDTAPTAETGAILTRRATRTCDFRGSLALRRSWQPETCSAWNSECMCSDLRSGS